MAYNALPANLSFAGLGPPEAKQLPQSKDPIEGDQPMFGSSWAAPSFLTDPALTLDAPPIFSGLGSEWYYSTPPEPNTVFGARSYALPQAAIDEFGGAQGVWNYFGGAPDPVAAWNAWAQNQQNEATLEAGHQAALDSISGLFDSPTYQTLSSELQRRAAPGYSVVSPAMESQMNRQVALATTRARDERAQRLRAAGLSGSGMDIENAGLYGTIGSVGLGGVQAAIAAENAAAQERALASLGDLGRVEAAITGSIADLQRDPVLSGYDWFQVPELAFGRQQYEDQTRLLEEAFADFDAQSQSFLPPQLAEGISTLIGVLNALGIV